MVRLVKLRKYFKKKDFNSLNCVCWSGECDNVKLCHETSKKLCDKSIPEKERNMIFSEVLNNTKCSFITGSQYINIISKNLYIKISECATSTLIFDIETCEYVRINTADIGDYDKIVEVEI